MGQARFSHDLLLSGSTVALGAAYRWSAPSGRRRPRAAGGCRRRRRRGRRRRGVCVPTDGRAVLGLAHRPASPGCGLGLGRSPASWRGPWWKLAMARPQSSSERRTITSSASGRWPAIDDHVGVDGRVGPARMRSPPASAGGRCGVGRVLLARRSTRPRATRPSMMAVTDERPHGQPVGQARRRRRPLGQNPQHPVLGQGQVDLGQCDFDPLGEPGGDSPVGAQDGGAPEVFRRRGRSASRRRARGGGGEVTDTSTIIQLEALTTCSGPGGSDGPVSGLRVVHSGSSWRRKRAQRSSSSISPMEAAASCEHVERTQEAPVGLWRQRT